MDMSREPTRASRLGVPCRLAALPTACFDGKNYVRATQNTNLLRNSLFGCWWLPLHILAERPIPTRLNGAP